MSVSRFVVAAAGVDASVVVGAIFVIIIAGGFILGLYMMHKQKQGGVATAATKETPSAKNKNVTANSSGQIQDSRWLVSKVEKIEDGIIVTDNGRRFVAAITCRGVDLYNAGINEQLSVMRGYQKFYNIIEKPITYRQYCKAIDLDIPKGRYSARHEEVFAEYGRYMDALQSAKEHQKPEDEIQRLAIAADRCERRLKHLEEQMNMIEFYSGSDVVMDVTQDYIFDWTYAPGVSDVKLSEAEIFLRAKSELNAIASQRIDALMTAGVKARMCTQDEMVDMFRHHSKPLGAEIFKQKMLRESSFEEDIVTSDSIAEASQALYEEDVKWLQDNLFRK